MKEIHESEEDYLEKILMLSYEMKDVRSIDLVKKMGFSKPSISVAVKNLEKAGKITRDDNGYITLTETGRQIAERIYARHILLTKLLVKLGIDEDEAVQEACRIEHDISQNTYEKLKKLADDYDYDGEGYAVWDFRSGAQDGDIDVQEVISIEELTENTYKVTYNDMGHKGVCIISVIPKGEDILFHEIENKHQ